METFTIVDDQLATFSSNLPLILINTFGRYISPNNKSGVSIQFLNNKRDGRSTVLGPMDFNGRASVNLRGYSTLRQPKNSMTIRLKDENDDKIKASLFGLPKESDWVLYAPYADKTMIRDALAYELSNAMGQYAPRTRFVEVYLDRNGGTLGQNDYMGVYVLVERVGVGKSRVEARVVPQDENTTRLWIQVFHRGKDGLFDSWEDAETPLPQSAENEVRLVKNALRLL